MNNGYILNFMPTGMITTKEMTPHVPITPDEIIQQVLEVTEVGVNMVHLHARDEAGVPDYKKEMYDELISDIRKHDKHIIFCVSTSGRNFLEFEKRSQYLELQGDTKPDFGSLTLGSLNFSRTASVNGPEMVQVLVKKMRGNGTPVEMEIFDLGMVNYTHYLIKRELIRPHNYCNILLGNIANAQAELNSPGLLISQLSAGSIWSDAGFGDCQLAINTITSRLVAVLGLGSKTIYISTQNEQDFQSNIELVKRVIDIGTDWVGSHFLLRKLVTSY